MKCNISTLITQAEKLPDSNRSKASIINQLRALKERFQSAGDMDFLLSADLQMFQHVHINTLDFRPVEVDERRSELEQFFRILHKHNYNQLLGLEYVTPASSSPDFDSLNWSKKYLKERMPK